jgi:hypothetical protein
LTLERFIDFRQVAEALAEDPTILFLTRVLRYHTMQQFASP